MPPSWHPVPACVPRLHCRRGVLRRGNENLNRTQIVAAAGTGATPAAFNLGLCRLRGILSPPVPACVRHDHSAGGPFFCAGDNPCSDSQIHPLKSGITAVLGLFLGKILQRFPSLPPEIRNHCTQEVVNGHNLAAIPKSGPEIKNHCTQEVQSRAISAAIPKSGPEIKNHCTQAVSYTHLTLPTILLV